ncbi:RNA-binding protein 42 isoform X1 [Gadus morhua]|uniref:RNA-binding protein 42 n=1 Tax=Gadus morhua TaxID=8049 RepID=A0A8C4ZJM7_GADMO|nr:RNA-binding protein 42 isoform X1 [Gadus morhua]XP_059921110.1 RNA-binding protein 42 isoform X1 [Gadus macrocephalus]
MALNIGEERLKEMEAEMALFEQEVLGGPVSAGGPDTLDAVPVTVPVVRAIIGTNTYRQVQQTLEAARAATYIPPSGFVGPGNFPPGMPPPPPMMRPAFMPHILQRPGVPRMALMRGPPPQGMMAPPLPRPPPPPPMMLPPALQLQRAPQAAPQPMQPHPHPHMLPVQQQRNIAPMNPAPPPRPVGPAALKPSPSIIQAAPTTYSSPPTPASGPRRPDIRAQRQARMEELAARVAEQQAAVMAAGLLEKKEAEEKASIGPAMPDPEPSQSEPAESATEDKKKGKVEKVKKCIRTAAGTTWEDQSMLEWETDDFRLFCGDLGNEVNDDILARAFSRYPSFLKAKVVRDKRTGKTKGYGFVSFKDPNDYVRAMREMNGKYVGSRPIKLRKSMWKDRNMEVVRKKQREKKKLGLR